MSNPYEDDSVAVANPYVDDPPAVNHYTVDTPSTISPEYTQRMIRDRTVTLDVRKQYLQREQDAARQEGAAVNDHAGFGKGVGFMFNRAGNVVKGGIQDVASIVDGQKYSFGENIAAAALGEETPMDEQLQGASGWQRVAADTSQAFSHMIPQLVVSGGVAGLLGKVGGVMGTAANPSTVAGMTAAGASFGFDENGFNPEAAASMALFPVAGKAGAAGMIGTLDKLGVKIGSEAARNAWGTAGSLGGMQAYMEALNTPTYLNPYVTKEEKLRIFANGLAMTIGFGIHGKMKEWSKAKVDKAARESAADVVKKMKPEELKEIVTPPEQPTVTNSDGMAIPVETAPRNAVPPKLVPGARPPKVPQTTEPPPATVATLPFIPQPTHTPQKTADEIITERQLAQQQEHQDYLDSAQKVAEGMRKVMEKPIGQKPPSLPTFDEVTAGERLMALPTETAVTSLSDNVTERQPKVRGQLKNPSIPQLISRGEPIDAGRLYRTGSDAVKRKVVESGYKLNYETSMWEKPTIKSPQIDSSVTVEKPTPAATGANVDKSGQSSQATTASPIETINRASQVRLTVPEGALQIRGTDSKGRKAVVQVDAFKKGNPFKGADIVTLEAGSIGKDKAFKPIEGEVGVTDKSKNIDTGALGEVGMGGAKPGEFETEGFTAVASKNASMKKLATELGISDYWESLKTKAVSDEALWQATMAKIDRDPGWQDRLIKEFTEKGARSMEAKETLALDHRLVDLKIERARVTRELEAAYEDAQSFPNRQIDVSELQIREGELIEKIQALMETQRASGTLMGRGFRARQLMMKADYSLEQMLRDKAAARGGKKVEPTEPAYAEIKRLNKEIQEALEKADKLQAEHEQKIKDMEAGIAAQETTRKQAQDELAITVEERGNLNTKLSKNRVPPSDAQVIKQRISYLLRKEADLKRRIATGDFSKRQRREIEPTAALLTIKARVAELKHTFAKMLIADRQARRTAGMKVWDSIKQSGHAFVNIMSSFDFSAPRQAFWAILSNSTRLATSPKAGYNLLRQPFAEMFAAFKNENTARKLAEKIKMRRNSETGVDKIAGVEFTDLEGHKLTGAEENARSILDEWAEKPYQTGNAAKNVAAAPAKALAKTVRMSNRAFITYLNTTRAGLLDHILNVEYHDRPPTDVELKVIGNLVNVATGRGKMNPMIAKVSSEVIWAPKLLTSRLQTLAGQPLWGGAPWKDSGKARKIVVKEYVRGIIAASALVAVQRAFTEQDPNEIPSTASDFGKVVRGLTRIDPWAGFQQLVVLEERIRKGETTTSKGTTSDIGTYGTGEVIWNFFKGKARPDITAMVKGVIAAIDSGKPLKDVRVTPKEAALGAIPVPIAVSEMVSVMRDRKMTEGAIIQVLSEFGAGVNVYEDKKKESVKPSR